MSNGNRDDVWQQSATALAGAASAWIPLPNYVRNVTVTIIPGGGGTAKLQHTTATPEAVIATPSGVQAIDWDLGNVSSATSKSAAGAITAVRVVATTANATIEVVGVKD